jgi:hypothetical protein
MGLICEGKHILYKDGNSGWLVGRVLGGQAEVNCKGVWIPILPKEFFNMKKEEVPYIHHAEINNIFTDAQPLDSWVKNYKDNFMTKEEYIDFVESDDFERAIEVSYVTDGEYIYYPISKYTRSWIEKQPFEYVVRNN